MPCFVAAGALALIGLRSRSAILRNGLWHLARHRRIGIVAAQDLVWYEPVVCYVVGSLLLGAMLMQLDLARGPTECTALRLHAARILKKTAGEQHDRSPPRLQLGNPTSFERKRYGRHASFERKRYGRQCIVCHHAKT